MADDGTSTSAAAAVNALTTVGKKQQAKREVRSRSARAQWDRAGYRAPRAQGECCSLTHTTGSQRALASDLSAELGRVAAGVDQTLAGADASARAWAKDRRLTLRQLTAKVGASGLSQGWGFGVAPRARR
jgi:predicted transglutaminase-like cysteine proteinase